MTAIPKLSSLTAHDKRMMRLKPYRSPRCIVCGSEATNDHHQPYRSHVPKAMHALIPTFSVCGMGTVSGCHRLIHAQAVHLDDIGGSLVLTADEEATREVNESRKLAGWRPVEPFVPFRPMGG